MHQKYYELFLAEILLKFSNKTFLIFRWSIGTTRWDINFTGLKIIYRCPNSIFDENLSFDLNWGLKGWSKGSKIPKIPSSYAKSLYKKNISKKKLCSFCKIFYENFQVKLFWFLSDIHAFIFSMYITWELKNLAWQPV